MVRPVNTSDLVGSRQKIAIFVESRRFVNSITGLILFNAITLGLETDAEIRAAYGQVLSVIDSVVLLIFTLELLLKLYAYRSSFFRSGWNNFDFIIVGIAWLPASGALSVLRALRILRILRLLSVVPQMRRVITALGHSIPGMATVIGILLLVFYVSAVLATKLFGLHPHADMQIWFGTIGSSAYTLFQIMTLESWSMGIVRPTMEIFPLAWMFFVPFIIITSFAVLNLFIGIIVDAMQTTHHETQQTDKQESMSFTAEDMNLILARLDELQGDIRDLKRHVQSTKKSAGSDNNPEL